jgi:beta-galactosidase
MRTQIEALRTQGVNALSLQGTPPSHEFYALCDELGVYLCNRADIDTHLAGLSRKVGGNPSNQPAWEGAYLDRVMSMYHTSKNSPSVVMFALARDSANGYNLYESYLALKAVEKQRPVIYPEGAEWNSDRLDFEVMDSLDYPDAGEQWAVITAEDVKGGRFKIHNTRYFTPIIGEAAYNIKVGKKIVSRGSIPVEVQPRSEAEFTIPINNVKEGKEFTALIEVKVPRRTTKYTPLPATRERKVFAGEFPLSEDEKTVIGQGDFPSGNEKM